MFGILLAGLSAFFGELAESIGKKEVRDKVSSFYTFGFLNMLFSTLFIVGLGIIRHDFIFSLASLPTLVPRLALEILQAHVSFLAIVKADRSDYGLVRILTIPLLLIVDLRLGYRILPLQLLGIVIILAAVFSLFYVEHFKTKGLWLLLFSGVNAVVTISLYKYDVTHFNSFEFEQSIICLSLMLYFYILAVYKRGQDPIRYLTRPLYLVQALASGASSAAGSFAILFAPASVITTALRTSAVLFSIFSGTFYFHEKRVLFKMVACGSMIIGLLLLVRT